MKPDKTDSLDHDLVLVYVPADVKLETGKTVPAACRVERIDGPMPRSEAILAFDRSERLERLVEEYRIVERPIIGKMASLRILFTRLRMIIYKDGDVGAGSIEWTDPAAKTLHDQYAAFLRDRQDELAAKLKANLDPLYEHPPS